MKSRGEIHRLESILVVLGPLVTLVISPTLSNDPINPIKLLCAATLAFGCLGLLIGIIPDVIESLGRLRLTFIFSFCLFCILPLVFTSTSIQQQIWGVFGRNTGVLNYLTLLFVLFSASVVRKNTFEPRFIKGMLITVVLTVCYCVIQIFQLDPIKWSFYAPFATLGNVNFSSAFLGLGLVIIPISLLSNKSSKRFTISFFMLFSVIYIIYKTGSIQGFLIVAIGWWSAFLTYTYIKNQKWFWFAELPISAILIYLSLLGFVDKGPLSKFLYQQTNIFRLDYWHAGLEMFKSSPLTGLGFDSYGDWYTEKRGIVSALRTGLVRTSNSAHNIFIDISVNGGIFLITSYFAILITCLVTSVKYIRKLAKVGRIDFVFLGIFSGWISYLSQALISINQIAVGIWGWLLTGLLFTSRNVEEFESLTDGNLASAKKAKRNSRKRSRAESAKTLGAGSAVFGLIFSIFGFFAAYVPFSADTSFRRASVNRDLNQMIDATNRIGSNSFALAETMKSALQNNYMDPAIQLSEQLILRFPRDQFAWKVRAKLSELSADNRNEAIIRIRNLEPYFACASPDPAPVFKSWVSRLPSSQQLELSKWWDLVPRSFNSKKFRIVDLDQDVLDARLRQLCL
jgi:O-antigen ligase